MDRKEKLDKALDALEEELRHTPMTVRLTIRDGEFALQYVLMGGHQFDPKWMYFNELPEFIAEKVAVLNMVNPYQEIATLGKRFPKGIYYIYMSPAVWESLVPLASVTKNRLDL